MSIDHHERTYSIGISLRPLLPWLLLASALSTTMMVLGAGRGDRFLPALAAGLLVALVAGTGLGINAPLWSRSGRPVPGQDGHAAIREALRCNVWLAALVYAWGASSLFAIYSLSDLTWRHSFQYGFAAALIGASLGIYGFVLGRYNHLPIPPLSLTVFHGLVVGLPLIYLITSGKLATQKGDWAANEVFLWGGIALVLLCLMTIMTQTRITRFENSGASSP